MLVRTQRRNRQKLYYSIPLGRSPKYVKDDNGNIIYDAIDGISYPRETGEYEYSYGEPVLFYGAIFSQLENAIMRAWGSDNTNNYAVLVLRKGQIPNLVNGTRIWRRNTPITNTDGSVNVDNAEYLVNGELTEELNEDSYYLTILRGDSNETDNS